MTKGNTMNNIKEFITKHKLPVTAGVATLLLATGGTIFALSTQDSKDTAPTYTQSTKSSQSTTSSSSSSTKASETKKEDFTEVEKAVKNAESNQTRENVASAQTLVDKVKDATKKAELQKRLDLVSHALNVKDSEAQAAAQAQAEAEAQAAAQAQAQAEAEAQAAAQAQSQYVAPANNGSTYVAPADNGGGTYTPPANNSGGTQPAGNGGYVSPDLSTDAGKQQQADQNGVWSQQAGSQSYSWAATGGQ